jgi:hypothetical protein
MPVDMMSVRTSIKDDDMDKFCFVADVPEDGGIEPSDASSKLWLSIPAAVSAPCSGLQLPASPFIYMPPSPEL